MSWRHEIIAVGTDTGPTRATFHMTHLFSVGPTPFQ